MIAFDMPYHGRSNPRRLVAREYRLTTAELHRLHPRRVAGARARAAGGRSAARWAARSCSKLAADYQQELRGIVGLESSAFAPGRYNDFLHHPAIHGGELAATYTYGLCAPQSPEASARENWWYYSQAGPGVYAGDVHFYSIDWDGREASRRIDTARVQGLAADRRIRLLVHAGDDASGRGGDSRRAPGHHERHRPFPDDRELPLFREYLLPELDFMRERRMAEETG